MSTIHQEGGREGENVAEQFFSANPIIFYVKFICIWALSIAITSSVGRWSVCCDFFADFTY
jgi:hypothetical protein